MLTGLLLVFSLLINWELSLVNYQKELANIACENHRLSLEQLWYEEVMLSLIILLASLVLYLVLRRVVHSHYSLHAAMKSALKHEKFFPVYQPIYNPKTNSYCGAEVLIRWQISKNEILMPNYFIREAESTGLIVPMTLQLMNKALQQTQALLIEQPDFYISFNISAIHFSHKKFFKQFYDVVDNHQIMPKQVMLEITERELLPQNDADFLKHMHQLRKAGYSLAIDDYGTGQASISYLNHFPFSHLKIDKQYIQAIGTKAITESLNQAIIQMAKSLQLTIIAEGVETQEQMQYLVQHDVGFLQGWYYSKAVAVEKLISLLNLK